MSATVSTRSPMSSTARHYERLRPLIVWLGLAEVASISWWLVTNGNGTTVFLFGVFVWVVLLLGWMAGVSVVAKRRLFLDKSRWFSNHVGLTAVVAMTVVVLAVIPEVRHGLLQAAVATSDRQLIAMHVLRLLSIGTAVKYLQGQLPRHFFVLGTVPDFLFALSAAGLLLRFDNVAFDPTILAIWHGVGAAVFLGAGVSMYFSVPSPLRLFHTKPDASLVFEFPMVLAPNFTVPLFIVAHLFAITKYVVTT